MRSKDTLVPIILAGGLSTRFGSISKYIPKFLFPIHGSTMLEKQILLLTDAGFKKIVISCRPELYENIQKTIFAYKNNNVDITIYKNNLHEKGPISALAGLESFIDDHALVVLSDIFFTSNPFKNLPVSLDNKSLHLLASRPQPEDYKEGGMVGYSPEDGYVIVEKTKVPLGLNSFRWCGSLIISKDGLLNLKKVINEEENEKMGDYYNKLLNLGYSYKILEVEKFINMNTLENLAQILTLTANKKNNGC